MTSSTGSVTRRFSSGRSQLLAAALGGTAIILGGLWIGFRGSSSDVPSGTVSDSDGGLATRLAPPSSLQQLSSTAEIIVRGRVVRDLGVRDWIFLATRRVRRTLRHLHSLSTPTNWTLQIT
jgi:hypothetical protein